MAKASTGSRRPLQGLAILFLALWAGPRAARGEGEPGSPALERSRTSTELLAWGDRSARAGRYSDALSAWKQAYERRFSGFRERSFLYSIEAAYLDRAGLRTKLREDFEKEMPEEKVVAERNALASFGLLPPDLDLKQTVLGLLTEEVAGFYDPDTKKLYLIKEEPKEEAGGFFERLFKKGFDPDEQKMLLVHEMSHALMDQRHDLLSMQRSSDDDDDMSMAIRALVEGEATLCMMVGPRSQKDMLRASPAVMDATMSLILPFMAFTGGQGLRRAPPLLKEELIFPYLKGLSFCLSLTSREGSWEPVERAFEDPPLSTEAILHPAKYRHDAPQALLFPDLLSELGKGWRPVRANVLGELRIRILLSQSLPREESVRASEGWGGDFYRVYQPERPTGAASAGSAASGELLLAWATTWDTDRDAAEFGEAIRKVLAVRGGGEGQEEDPQRLPAGASGRSWRAEGRAAALLRRGREVWVLQGLPEATLPAVARKVTELERSPKTYKLQRAKPALEFPEERRLRAARF